MEKCKVILIGVLVAGLGILTFIPLTAADIPQYITFQGRLTDVEGTPVADGTYTVTFRLYAQESGGEALWTETQTVSVTNGVFTTALGLTTSLATLSFDREYWLSVQVSEDVEMSPRQRLTSAGYAINADRLDTYTSEQFLRSDAQDIATGQLILTYPQTALIIRPSSAPDEDTKLIDVQDTSGTSKFTIDSEGDLTLQGASLSGALGVSGTTTLSGATTVTGSLAVGTGVFTVDTSTGRVGIGTTQPEKPLHIVGDTDILGHLAIGTANTPKDITVQGDLNVVGDQNIVGTTNYAGDLIIGSDGTGYSVRFYSDTAGRYLLWDGTNAQMSLLGGVNLDLSGNLDVDGDLQLAGRIRQGSLGDLAEMMPLAACIVEPLNISGTTLKDKSLYQRPEPAEVVIIDAEGGVRRSFKPFAPNVVGIISSNPAQILRDGLGNSVPVALNGVVPCKVTRENGPIKPGDLLVSASLPGHAMRAGKNPPPGTVVGKALERLDAQVGIIQVLVMLK